MKNHKKKKLENIIEQVFIKISILLTIISLGAIFGMACLFIARLNITILRGVLAYGCMFAIFGFFIFPYIEEWSELK